MPRDCRIVERPDELLIQVRWISRLKGAVLLAMLLAFFIVMIWVADRKTPFVVFAIVMSYPALLIALNGYRLKIKDGCLTTSVGPIPVFGGRNTLAAADICEVLWSKTVGTTGRGGRMERYALQVETREIHKPLTLLDAELENDTRVAAEALVRWLNAHLAKGADPVVLR